MEREYSDVDFNRVGLLLHIVIEAGPNKYPAFSAIYQAAMRELTMINDNLDPKKAQPQTVTPPDGPSNSAILNPDGTYTRIEPAPIPANPGLGERLTAEAEQARAKDVRDATNRESFDRAGVPPVGASAPDPRSNESPAPGLSPEAKARIDTDARVREEQIRRQQTGAVPYDPNKPVAQSPSRTYEQSVDGAGEDFDGTTPRRA